MSSQVPQSEFTRRYSSHIPTSSSVTSVIQGTTGKVIPAWNLVYEILTLHNEYGNYLGKKLVETEGPELQSAKPVSLWLLEVTLLFEPQIVRKIHGRIFILALCEWDSILAKYLDSFGFRDALRQELREPFESLIQPVLRLSESVEIAISKFLEGYPIPSWKLVQEILSQRPHPEEYGHLLGEGVFAGLDQSEGTVMPATDWLMEIMSLYDFQKIKRLNFETFVLGLCELDANLGIHLDSFTNGFRNALREKILVDIGMSYESLLKSSSATTTTETTVGLSTEYTKFHADAATEIDQLGRQGFAEALAIWLNRIWGDNYIAYVQLRTALASEKRFLDGSSFIIHLHGPWGAGKTSLLRLMENAIRNISLTIGRRRRTWQVIWFNAWRNRHLDPAWWPLMDRIYRETVDQTAMPTGTKAWETWWRTRITGTGQYIIAIGMAVLTLIGLWIWTRSSGGTLVQLISGLSTMITFAITIGSGVLALSRSLASGSSASAQNFVRLSQDPMERIRLHFSELLDRVNGPVMVLIDDLDRCQPEYVVRLLESIQTLFNDPRVVYVISADRRWLYECFETVYKDFIKSIHEPGRRTGYLFLEKIFQMSISVPAMSEETQKAYLDYLYRGKRKEAEEKMAQASKQADEDFARTSTTEELVDQLEAPQPDPDPLVIQIRREAAVRRLASQEVSADIEHFLQPFSPLLERNPRAMKRLVNAYSIHLALAILADIQLINSDEKKKRFALWTILSLRWPALAEKLEQDPEILPDILKKETGRLDPDLSALAREVEVQRVLHGEAEGIGVSIDEETFSRLLGLQASPGASVVA